MEHSSLAIANEFIGRGLKEGARPITHMQTQKLVYLAHGWSLGAFDRPLIEDQIEAWKFGPVIRKLYAALSRFGSGPVTHKIRWGSDTILFGGDDGDVAYEELSQTEADIVDLIWEVYGGMPAFKLSALTHQEDTPWSRAYAEGANRVISNTSIKKHFEALIAA